MEQRDIKIKVRDLVKGYSSSEENGVRGYDGKLNIRPPYQREFIYDDRKQKAVIDTILNNCCLGYFHWSDNGDGTYEVLDGQQRTLSICKYVQGDFSYNGLYFGNSKDIQEKILDFEITVNIVKGGELERLMWFEKINVAGEVLTKQELRNATYVGEWLSDAKLYFSKKNCTAFNKANLFIKGDPIRQEYLELAIKWITHSNSDDAIRDYMAKHQFDENANELKEYFCKVIDWVEDTFDIRNNFPKGYYRTEMRGLDWGTLYEKYHNNTYNPQVLENKVAELMANEEVTNKKGIYEYVLSNEDEDVARELSNRKFSDRDKRTKYEQQKGICPICGEWHDIKEMEGDHIIPWWKGGTTTFDNLQMLCKKCNGKKSGS